MKKILGTIFVLTILGIRGNAQVDYRIQSALDYFRTNKTISGEWKNLLTAADIKGSPYASEEFVTGTIYTTQMQQIVDVNLRYNIFNDQMEFKAENGEIQAIATPEIVEKIELKDVKMRYLPFSVAKKIRKGYFTVLEDGESMLLLRQEKLFKEAALPGAYKEAEPARFEDRPIQYFIKAGTAEAKLVNSKKDLLEIFPDQQDAIEKFIKENKTRTNKPEDLAAVVKFYNSL